MSTAWIAGALTCCAVALPVLTGCSATPADIGLEPSWFPAITWSRGAAQAERWEADGAGSRLSVDIARRG
jgi:hypothetical protein